MGIKIEDLVPVLGMANGKGWAGDMFGKKSENDAAEQQKQQMLKDAADQKAAQEKQAAQAQAQQWANRPAMKKGGMVKKMADGGTAKVPQDVDGASATRSPKKGEKPTYEEPGSGIRVDGKPLNKAKGGMVSSSASRRADGMASRGKTRGKMC